MKLYYATGTCSLAPHVALIESGLPFDAVEGRPAQAHARRRQRLLRHQPEGLRAAARARRRHQAVGSRRDPAIHRRPRAREARPGVRHDRALSRDGVAHFVNSEVHKQYSPLWYPTTPDASKEQQRKKLASRFEYLVEGRCSRSRTSPATTFTIADAYLFTILNWSHGLKIDLSPYPALLAYQDRIRARPSVQRAMTDEGLIKPQARNGSRSDQSAMPDAVPLARLADARRSSRARPARAWATLGRTLPRPRAVLVASAHWETVGADADRQPASAHDPRLRRIPAGALRAALSRAGRARSRRARGGAAQAARASPPGSTAAAGSTTARGCRSLHMYPSTTCPSCSSRCSPALGTAHHVALGRALAPLASEGMLIVGSGHATHNLRDWMAQSARRTDPMRYAQDFTAWVHGDARSAGHRSARRLSRARAGGRARRIPPRSTSCRCWSRGAPPASVRAPSASCRGFEAGALAIDSWCSTENF